MGEQTKIEWTDHTFNPWIGCTHVSPGCEHCYAEALERRWGRDTWGPGKPRRRTSAENWALPQRWNAAARAAKTRRRVFCASLADVFDPEAPAGALADLWALIDITQDLDWLLLTKRPDRIEDCLPSYWGNGLKNVWLGITVEDQRRLRERAPILANIPAVVHFWSAEPLLEDISGPAVGLLNEFAVDWIIIGGESGGGARRFEVGWARRLMEAAGHAQVPCFMKQLGAKPTNEEGPLVKLGDRKGGDWNEWPLDLRHRAFPKVSKE